MSSISDFHDYVVGDVLMKLGARLSSKQMFGGYGLYLDGKIFGMITSESDLYFKVGEANKADYEAANSQPFVYTGHKTKGPTTMPYWRVPEEIMEDAGKVADWAEKAAANSK